MKKAKVMSLKLLLSWDGREWGLYIVKVFTLFWICGQKNTRTLHQNVNYAWVLRVCRLQFCSQILRKAMWRDTVFVSHVSVFVDIPSKHHFASKQQTSAAFSHKRSGLVNLFGVTEITKLEKQKKNKWISNRHKLNRAAKDVWLGCPLFCNIDPNDLTANRLRADAALLHPTLSLDISNCLVWSVSVYTVNQLETINYRLNNTVITAIWCKLFWSLS